VLLLQGIAFVMILASESLRDFEWKALWVRIAPRAGVAASAGALERNASKEASA
jgi:hypothetical protein